MGWMNMWRLLGGLNRESVSEYVLLGVEVCTLPAGFPKRCRRLADSPCSPALVRTRRVGLRRTARRSGSRRIPAPNLRSARNCAPTRPRDREQAPAALRNEDAGRFQDRITRSPDDARDQFCHTGWPRLPAARSAAASRAARIPT